MYSNVNKHNLMLMFLHIYDILIPLQGVNIIYEFPGTAMFTSINKVNLFLDKKEDSLSLSQYLSHSLKSFKIDAITLELYV